MRNSATALSTTAFDNGFVEKIYGRLARVYDWAFGPILQAGRTQALGRLHIRPGDTVLEVGIGTGLSATLYPGNCRVTGIDFSSSMLKKAARRLASTGIDNVRLQQMDAADLQFPDESFDAVYAAYVMSVVPDPLRVAREMRRVCRPGGRIVMLNHFRSNNALLARAEQLISPLTLYCGFTADLDLTAVLEQAGLELMSIEKVNIPPIWSLLTCRRATSDPS